MSKDDPRLKVWPWGTHGIACGRDVKDMRLREVLQTL